MTKLMNRPPMATHTQPVMTSSSERFGNFTLHDERTQVRKRM